MTWGALHAMECSELARECLHAYIGHHVTFN